MWDLDDFYANRVDRCSRCQGTANEEPSSAALIFESFKQPAEDHCPVCYGSTFEGGWRAQIVRPAIWNELGEEVDQIQPRGEVHKQAAHSVESTWDFYMRDGDYIFRPDGSRWQVGSVMQTRLVAGFGYTSRAESQLGVNLATVTREEDTAVAFDIPPLTRTELTNLLDIQSRGFPQPTSFAPGRGPDALQVPVSTSNYLETEEGDLLGDSDVILEL